VANPGVAGEIGLIGTIFAPVWPGVLQKSGKYPVFAC
jgi:hypothetical protein